ncbi:MAG: AAA family ATPase, partial [Polyangiaceae bacterium]|nr:AAA family ATPase [Polyangiaceae bacterium]
LHRDLKPSNVLVTKGGLVKILDFGLVTRLFAAELAVPETLVGTPVYMAPELCASLAPSPASDWYSVGVMLYTILTGKLPFAGPLDHVILAKQCLDARPASEVVTGPIPADLDILCSSLLAKSPVARPEIGHILATFAAGAAAAAASGRSPETRPRLHALPGSFVGRAREVARLAALLGQPRDAAGAHVVLVEGLSGVGKTSLIEHLLREAEGRGDLVLRSRCFERGSVRWKALDGAIDDLASHLAQLSRDELRRVMPSDARERWALGRLFPVLSLDDEAGTAPEEVDPVELKRRAFEGLRGLFHAVAAQRRIVVEIDDAQWSDDDSLAPLTELLRAPSPPSLWFIAYRSDEKDQSHFLRAFAAGALPLVPPERRELVELGPLPPEEALRLAVERLGSAPDEAALDRARAIAREADGHPLLIDELARASFGSAGEDVGGHLAADRLSELLRARIVALPPEARVIVELVALASEPVDVRLVRAASGADQRDLNLLVTDRLLRVRPGHRGGETVVTWHDRVREVATAAIPEGARPGHHRVLAETAERLGDADPYFLYVHWRGAGERARARVAAITAAEAAERAFAFERAALLYTRALELADTRDAGLVERLAAAEKNAGRGIEAGRAFLEAAAAARDADEVRRLEIAAAEQFLFAGGLAEGEAVIAKVLARTGLSLRQSVPSVLGALAWQSLRLKLRGWRYTARPESEAPRDVRAVVDTLWSATLGMSLVHPLTSTAIQKRHLRMALDLGDPLRITKALGVEVAFSGLPGKAEGSRAARHSQALIARAEAVARTVPHPYASAFVTMGGGGVHWLRGRWRAAQAAVEAALAVYETACVGVTWEKDTACFVALSALLHQGAVPELRARTERALADATQRGDRFLATQLRTRFVPFLMLADDRPEAIAPETSEALAGWRAHGYQVVHLYAWMAAIEAALYTGDAAGAQALLASGTKPLKRSFILLGQYYRVQFHELAGRVALAARDPRAALRHAARLAREGMPWATPFADSLRGHATGDASRLAAAAGGFSAVDMALHALAAEHAHARALRDDPRAADAEARTRALGVCAPGRLLSSISSGSLRDK